MRRRDFLINGMKGLALLSMFGCNTVQKWAEKQNKRTKQKEYDILSKHVCGTRDIVPKYRDTRWGYAIEDIKDNPVLHGLINKKVDVHGVAGYYKKINNDKEPVAGSDYLRPVWCFENSD